MAEPGKQRPLGLKEGFEVPQSVLEKLAYIEAFDLEADPEYASILKRLTHGGATREFKRFLALPLLYPGDPAFSFVPSLPLDSLWHAFILNTPRYRGFCDHVYGSYLDHVPARSRHQTEQRVFAGPMQFTVEKVNGAFDSVNRRFWRKLAFCGPCLLRKG
ncbi:MAG TPA: hypothetical protein VMO26_06530 [Vicinamibacterales bacterium]|nr:hypothetical protein [Vicinamibacterales bacterium]